MWFSRFSAVVNPELEDDDDPAKVDRQAVAAESVALFVHCGQVWRSLNHRLRHECRVCGGYLAPAVTSRFDAFKWYVDATGTLHVKRPDGNMYPMRWIAAEGIAQQLIIEGYAYCRDELLLKLQALAFMRLTPDYTIPVVACDKRVLLVQPMRVVTKRDDVTRYDLGPPHDLVDVRWARDTAGRRIVSEMMYADGMPMLDEMTLIARINWYEQQHSEVKAVLNKKIPAQLIA